jgi:hypothetical protein
MRFEGADFLRSCMALREKFDLSVEDLVFKLEAKMIELSNAGRVVTVNGNHLDAVRQQLENKPDWEPQPTSSGSVFFRHKVTGETRWVAPGAGAVAGDSAHNSVGSGQGRL